MVKVYSIRKRMDSSVYLKELFVRENVSEYANTPEDIRDLLNTVFQANQLPEEHSWLLCMDTKGKIVGLFELSSGTISGSLLSPRELIQRALLVNAASIAIGHCHPSGDPTPSRRDFKITEQVSNACGLMNILFMDHVIIGQGASFYSFRQEVAQEDTDKIIWNRDA